MFLGYKKASGEYHAPSINPVCQEEYVSVNLQICFSYKPPAGICWQGVRLIKNVSYLFLLFLWESKMKYY